MIQNIVFDMGGVLIRWNPEEMLHGFDLTGEEMAILNRDLFKSVEWIRLDRGTLSEDEAVSSVCARIPEKLWEPVKTIVYGWHQRYLPPMPGMAELVGELKQNGYRIFLLSNASQALHDYFPRIPGAEYFEKLMVSADEKLLKPSHEIFERLYEKFDLEPGQCWFIDDSPANVEGAMCTGMDGTVFYGDVTRLRRELRNAGIRCGETGGTT